MACERGRAPAAVRRKLIGLLQTLAGEEARQRSSVKEVTETLDALVAAFRLKSVEAVAAVASQRDGIDEPFEDVREFQKTFGYPVGCQPQKLERAVKERRLMWLREELDEFAAADTVEDQADAIIDLMYFAFGCLVEMGVPPHGVWNAVHKANMAKLWPDGVHTSAVGKVVKPEEWQSPEAEIRRYIAALREEADCGSA